MNSKSTLTLSIIGTGNVAYALANKFASLPEISLVSVYSRNFNNAAAFSEKFKFNHYTDSVAEIKASDFVLISVKDDAIPAVVNQLPVFEQTIYCHTAGSVGLEVFKSTRISQFGVFYPLQTFNKHGYLIDDNFPILVEGNKPEVTEKIVQLANKISVITEVMNANKRAQLHVAAVMVNNFTNFMLAQAQEYCNKQNLNFDLLKPLLNKTLQRVLSASENIWNFQTGPAVRNDIKTIEKHLEILSNFPEVKEIYTFLTQKITDKQKNNHE
jgi:predicted short-subunit dehydrogenase-like oxidoreductase (DUF2520 family)